MGELLSVYILAISYQAASSYGKVLLHFGICWQIWVIDERATNERARNLKVGFDVDQLGIAAAETVGFSLQKVSSSFSSFFVNRDNSCCGGIPNMAFEIVILISTTCVI